MSLNSTLIAVTPPVLLDLELVDLTDGLHDPLPLGLLIPLELLNLAPPELVCARLCSTIVVVSKDLCLDALVP